MARRVNTPPPELDPKRVRVPNGDPWMHRTLSGLVEELSARDIHHGLFGVNRRCLMCGYDGPWRVRVPFPAWACPLFGRHTKFVTIRLCDECQYYITEHARTLVDRMILKYAKHALFDPIHTGAITFERD